MIKIVFT